MSCRRCGFEGVGAEGCALCGWQVDWSMSPPEQQPRYFPLVLRLDTTSSVAPPELTELARATAQSGPACCRTNWFLFDLQEPEPFLQAMEMVREQTGWELILDGCVRPYAQELWLPFLSLFQGADR